MGAAPFNAEDYCTWTESAALTAATYAYALEALSDTGENGFYETVGSVTVSAPPADQPPPPPAVG